MKQHLALVFQCGKCKQITTARNFIRTFEDEYNAMNSTEARRWLLENAELRTIHDCGGSLGIDDVIGMRDVTEIVADHPSGIREAAHELL